MSLHVYKHAADYDDSREVGALTQAILTGFSSSPFISVARRDAESIARTVLDHLRRDRDDLRTRMEALADEFDARGRRGSAHFGADVGDTIRLWIDRDPRATPPASSAEVDR